MHATTQRGGRYGSYTHMAGALRRAGGGGGLVTSEKSVVFTEFPNFSKCRPQKAYPNIPFLPLKYTIMDLKEWATRECNPQAVIPS